MAQPAYYYNPYTPSTPPRPPSSRNAPAPVSPIQPAHHALRQQHPGSGSNPYAGNVYDVSSIDPLVSPIMSRTPSVAGSDRFSSVSGVTGHWPQNPDNVQPAAAYVAPLGASQVVSEHRKPTTSSDDDEGSATRKDDAQFSPEALKLVNSFLDQLLYSFLSTAKSTSLYALRPAVTDVLKARLAKEAISTADEELQELLAGGEEEEEKNTLQNSRDSRRWDLELVWKRTRLRVMVYMRLGEMEDEDEERHVKEQELFYGRESDSRRFSANSGLMSWSAAIFLTSVLEYIAEQTLQVAGTAAYSRARRQGRTQEPSATAGATASPEQVTVEEYDVERVALDARLGRLWRTWRKSQRNDRRPITPTHRIMGSRSSFSRDGVAPAMTARRESYGIVDGAMAGGDHDRHGRPRSISQSEIPEMQYPEHVLASNIPLPMQNAKRDVDEIEVPGLAKDPDAEEGEDRKRPTMPARRNSSYTDAASYRGNVGLPTPVATPRSTAADHPTKPPMTRTRSLSVPTPMRTPVFEIPGAFPSEQSSQPPQAVETQKEARPRPEQKASASDMEGHRPKSRDVKMLLDKAADNALPEDENQRQEQKSKSEHHGLLGAAAAGATAVAGAAAAMVYGQQRDRSQDKSLRDDRALNQDRQSRSDLPPQRVRSPQEIEELDRRKSLVDMKSIMGAESVRSSRGSSLSRAADNARSSSVARPSALSRNISDATDKSFTLGHRDRDTQKEIIPPSLPTEPHRQISGQDLPEAVEAGSKSSLGVDTTQEALPQPSPQELEELEGTLAWTKARDVPISAPLDAAQKVRERPSRSAGSDAAVADANAAPIVGSPVAAKEFLQSRNITFGSEAIDHAENAKYVQVQSPEEKTRAVPQQQRASVPLTASVAAAKESSPAPQRQGQQYGIWQPATEQKSDGSPKPPRPLSVPQKKGSKELPVQEHPAIKQMQSPKKEKEVPASSGTATPPVVTSSSIRGPEDFDSLLQRDDTVKYTLTPETVRDQPRQPVSAVVPAQVQDKRRTSSNPISLAKLSGQASEGASASPSKKSAPIPVPDSRDSRLGRSQASKPVTAAQQDREDDTHTPNQDNRRRSISKPPPRNTSAHRRSGMMAREPQIMTESTRDFADFIRSTGPDREPELYRLQTNKSSGSLASVGSTGRSVRSQSIGASSVASDTRSEKAKSVSKVDMIKGDIPPIPSMPPPSGSGRSKAALQARSASGVSGSNADLINFIRDGPEEQGQHRISRSVAPFRNTMDSDQFNEMGGVAAYNGGKPQDLKLNTNVNAAPSTKNATKSPGPRAVGTPRSTVANGVSPMTSAPPPTMHPAHSGQPQILNLRAQQSAGGDVERKRYRNKDPYAIDLDSDEEDDDLLTALPRNKRREESLADFLRNSEPPADNAPRPIGGATGTAQAREVMSKARENSVNTLRQNTNGADSGRTRSMQAQPGPQQARPHASSLRSNGSGPAPGSTASLPSAMKRTGPKLEARGAGGGGKDARLGAFHGSDTGDLADFLRSSGPPVGSEAPAPIVGRGTQQRAPSPEKKKRGFFASFGRKNKEKREKKTWLDMP